MMLRNLLFLALVSFCFAEPVPEPVPEPVLQEEVEEPKKDDICEAQAGEITKLYYNSGEWLNIFADVAFPCPGKLTMWVLHAKLKGQVFLTVWRPRPSGTAWNFVGKNLIHADDHGKNTFYIPESSQISVEAGDVIGVQYPRDDPDAEMPTERGVIPYENDEDFPWDNPTAVEDALDFPFSRIHNKQIFDEDIDPAKRRNGVRDFKRRAALAGYLNVPDPCQSNPCENGGTCTVINGPNAGYECECPPDFIGENCELPLECELAGGPLEHLAYDSGTWLNIFTEFSFPCSGRIVEWRFYAKKTGQMYLTAWRPDPTGKKSYTIIGKNLIEVTSDGVHRVYIDEKDQISVLAGDVFGVHYPDELADDTDDRGIVPYVDNRPGGSGLCCGITEAHLSELYNVNIQDTEITDNPTQDGDHIRDFKRAVAMSAFIYNPICGLQLGPRANLSYDSGQWLNVFVNRPVECDGKLFRWEFYAKKTGTFYLSVWEGSMGAGFTLKGYNEITVVDSNKTHVVDIASEDQLSVSPDNVIGIFYPDRAADDPSDRGIIPYRNDDDFPWWTSIYQAEDDTDDDFDFLQLHNVDVQFSSIVGTDYLAGQPYRPFERIPALAAYVDESGGRTVKVL